MANSAKLCRVCGLQSFFSSFRSLGLMARNLMKVKGLCFAGVIAALTGTISCNKDNGPVRGAVSHKDTYQQAYVYGFPMITAYKAMYQFNVDKSNSQYKGPFNQVLSTAQVFTPKDTAIVTPNSDTPYSMLEVDLRAEPIIFCVPKIEKNRYYSAVMRLYWPKETPPSILPPGSGTWQPPAVMVAQ